MLTVTIYIAAPGATLAKGGTSSVGHMWYSLDDGQGNTPSYGFSPDIAHDGWPIAPGEVNAQGYKGTGSGLAKPHPSSKFH